jgi:hypothetical protein
MGKTEKRISKLHYPRTNLMRSEKMKKEISTILMTIPVIIMVMLLGSAGASAADQLPLVCGDGTFTVMPYTDGAGEFPRPAVEGECSSSTDWVWEYLISADEKQLQALTKLHVYIPSLPPETINVYGQHVADRGEGGVSTPFGKGNFNGVVVSLTPLAGASSTTAIFKFCTDVNTTGTVSVLFDTAKSETGCAALDEPPDFQGSVGGIIGPGFGPSPYAILETDKRIQLGESGGIICAKKHPRTGCVKYFYDCSDTSQQPLPWQETPAFIDGELVDLGDLESPLCREAIFARKASPISYWGSVGGKYVCFGVYDPAVPSYTPAPPAVCN